MIKLSFKEFISDLNKYISPNKKPFIIGIAGGSGSGKTYAAKKIFEKLNNSALLSMDDYIIGEKIRTSENWDIPEVYNLRLLDKHLKQLQKNKSIKKPIYDFSKNESSKTEKIIPKDIIIIEGLFALSNSLLNELDLKIFVDADEKLRLERRVERDLKERGSWTIERIVEKWNKSVQPMYVKYIEPQIKNSDLIIKS